MKPVVTDPPKLPYMGGAYCSHHSESPPRKEQSPVCLDQYIQHVSVGNYTCTNNLSPHQLLLGKAYLYRPT